MNEKVGIKDLLEIIVFFCRLSNGVDAALSDGSIGVFDAKYLWSPLKAAGPAFKGASQAIKEFKDLDEEEKKIVAATVVDELDLSIDAVEEVIEDIVESALNFYVNLKKISILKQR